jgi:hypothetical protein
MTFKLIQSARTAGRRQRTDSSPVRAGATFINGKLVERPG